MRYLISVFVNGKCKVLQYSDYLDEIPKLSCKYPKHQIIIHDLASFAKVFDSDRLQCRRLAENVWRRKRGAMPTKVRMIEADMVFNSVKQCAKATGIGAMNIYQSIHSGYTAGGQHFEYYFDEDNQSDQGVHDRPDTGRANDHVEADV